MHSKFRDSIAGQRINKLTLRAVSELDQSQALEFGEGRDFSNVSRYVLEDELIGKLNYQRKSCDSGFLQRIGSIACREIFKAIHSRQLQVHGNN